MSGLPQPTPFNIFFCQSAASDGRWSYHAPFERGHNSCISSRLEVLQGGRGIAHFPRKLSKRLLTHELNIFHMGHISMICNKRLHSYQCRKCLSLICLVQSLLASQHLPSSFLWLIIHVICLVDCSYEDYFSCCFILLFCLSLLFQSLIISIAQQKKNQEVEKWKVWISFIVYMKVSAKKGCQVWWISFLL